MLLKIGVGTLIAMNIRELSEYNTYEAINYESVKMCLKKGDTYVEPLFDTLQKTISVRDPLTLYTSHYAHICGCASSDLLDAYLRVKTSFYSLDYQDVVVKKGDLLYPSLAQQIHDSPRFLYLRGDTSLLSRRLVAVVGTRNPSKEGKLYTQKSVEQLIKANTVTTSALALGIDGIAHVSALSQSAPTIAVIGTSLTESYPAPHKELQKIIGERGLIISQFSPSLPTQKYFFLLRNRLMGCITESTVVVEDRDGGGGTKQALYSLEYGRSVFLYQHVLENRSLLWPRQFARREGVMVLKKPEYLYTTLQEQKQQREKPQQIIKERSQLSLFDSY